MHQPSTWVIGIVRDDKVAGCWQHSDITTWCITGCESDSGFVVGTCPLSQYPEVVAMKMDPELVVRKRAIVGQQVKCDLRMSLREGSADDEINPFVCIWELDNVLICAPGIVAFGDL